MAELSPNISGDAESRRVCLTAQISPSSDGKAYVAPPSPDLAGVAPGPLMFGECPMLTGTIRLRWIEAESSLCCVQRILPKRLKCRRSAPATKAFGIGHSTKEGSARLIAGTSANSRKRLALARRDSLVAAVCLSC